LFNNVMEAVNQVVRLAQVVGIPVMGFLFALGFIFLLTAGKNPIRKRRGVVFLIVFGLGTFIVAYVPALMHTFAGDAPTEAQTTMGSGKTVSELVNATQPFGTKIFTALKYVAFPITGTMFYVGVFVKLLAGKSPQRKRLGLGLAIFSPITMGLVLVIPLLLGKL
jgi:hypothetical protein